MGRGNRIDVEWLTEHYPEMTSIDQLLDDHEAEFGWRPSRTAVYVRANRLGIRKRPVANHDGRAERTVTWCREPEMEAWMLRHDHGQRTDALSAEFRERWGFGLSRGQITQFRQSHGTQTRRHHGGGKPLAPVGHERMTKDGMVMVKIAERPSTPGSKDNWMLKHVHVWEQVNGPLPDGYNVYFADGDTSNFDPDNLVAVPRRLVGVMNWMRSRGVAWYDRETLQAVIALAEVRMARNDALAAMRRTCPCCGREFDNVARRRGGGAVTARVCPECAAAGRYPSNSGPRERYDHGQILRMHERGMSPSDIALALGCSPTVVSNVIHGTFERRKKDRAARHVKKESQRKEAVE